MAASVLSDGTKEYDAFGNSTNATGAWQTLFGYAGGLGYQESDASLKLLGHRYYDSETGRFLTRDPIKDGRTWYGYAENNPVRLADPTGLWATDSYIGDVGQVLLGYGDAINPVNQIQGIAGLIDLGRKRGLGAVGMAIGHGLVDMVTFWNAEDPRDFGNRFGGFLLAVGTMAAGGIGAGGSAGGAGGAGAGAGRVGGGSSILKHVQTVPEELVLMVEGHGGLPARGGPPNGIGIRKSPKEGNLQLRFYDEDGNAFADIDWGHDHGLGDPHFHLWNPVRDAGNRFP